LPPSLEGIQLYGNNCASCHGPLSSSTKRDRSAAQIQSAILTQPQMTYLSFLTPSQVQSIATALSMPEPPPPAVASAKSQVSMGDRNYMASVFRSIFMNQVSPAPDDAYFEEIIAYSILRNPGVFGGPCNRYDRTAFLDYGSCSETHDANTKSSQNPLPNALRKGHTNGVCDKILSVVTATTAVLSKVSLTETSPATEPNLQAVYDLFFPGRPMAASVVAALRDLHDRGTALGFAPVDRWRFVLVAQCQSTLLDQI
jgi:hypothetical protein